MRTRSPRPCLGQLGSGVVAAIGLVAMLTLATVTTLVAPAGAAPTRPDGVHQVPSTTDPSVGVTSLDDPTDPTEPITSSGSDAAVLGIGVIVVTAIGVVVLVRQRRRERAEG